MIIDFSELESVAELQADLCIVGAGAAGLTIAREFASCDWRVLVLEAGADGEPDPAHQESYKSTVIGLPHRGVHHGRARALGGTTNLWAGQALPFFDIDFEQRHWVAHSGWPVQRNSLDPYYQRAEQVMQIPPSTYGADSWPRIPPPPDYAGDRITPYYSQFTATPNFSHKYRELVNQARNIRLITRCNVTSLEANAAASHVEHINLKGYDGRTARARARYFVVCCGGIETARLLLLSDSVESHWLGNRHDVVGRYFQDHPGIGVPIHPTKQRRFSAWNDSFRKGSIRYSLKLATSANLQRQARILHTGAEVYYPADEGDPIAAAKQLLRIARRPRRYRELPAAAAPVARHPVSVARAAYRYYVRKQPASVGSGVPHLGIGCEQQPNPASRVTLTHEKDSLGMRRVALDWRLTELESRSIETFLQTISSEWTRLGIAQLVTNGLQINGREQGEHGGYVDGFHHMGTTRMGTDPRCSVVDPNCHVHGYDNLLIGGTAVFPTSGFSNPTLTALALCLRICDRLKENLLPR